MNSSIKQDKLYPSEEITEELKNIPHLSERMLVDLVNGLEVTEDLLKFKENQGGFSRFVGFIDGSNRRRQIMIEQNHQRSLESLTSWVLELTKNGTYTNKAITYIGDRLIETRKAVQQLMDLSMKNHSLVQEHEVKLKHLEEYIQNTREELGRRIEAVKNENDARYRIDEVVEAWKADAIYSGYPPYIQMLFVIQDLNRGDEGHILFSNTRYKAHIFNIIINTLKYKYNIGKTDYRSLKMMLTSYCSVDSNLRRDITCYLCEATNGSLLLSSIRDYVESNAVPSWLEESQKQGKLSTFYQTDDFLNGITQAICVGRISYGA